MGRILVIEGMILKWGGGDTPLQTMIADTSTSSLYSVLLIFMVFDFRFTPGV